MIKKRENRKMYSLRINPSLISTLKVISKKYKIPVSQIIEESILSYINREILIKN